MRQLYIASILLVLILLEGCELFMEKWYYIYVRNDSKRYIYVVSADGLASVDLYPDTLLPHSQPHLDLIKPNTIIKLVSSRKWEDRINNLIPSDTLSIYFFDADTVNICGWEEVAKDYKVLKRYDLSVDDLIKTNWTVTYP